MGRNKFRIKEHGQGPLGYLIIIFLVVGICACAIVVIGPMIQDLFPGAVTIRVNTLPDLKPFMMIETMDPLTLDGDINPYCQLYVRGTFLNGTGTIPENGKFACLYIPPEKRIKGKDITFLLGSVGYEPTPLLANQGGYYQFTIVGFMPAVGVLPVPEGVVYNSTFDERFDPDKPRDQVFKSLVGCMMYIIQTRDISQFIPCETAGYFPTGEIVWQGPYGDYHDRVWIAAVDSGRIKLFPLSAYAEMTPLLGVDFASEEFFKQSVDILNSQPAQYLLPWDGVIPDLSPFSP